MNPGLDAFHLFVAPCMPARHLIALLAALESDDKRLVQHQGFAVDDGSGACCGACAMSWGYWQADGLKTAEQVADGGLDLCVLAERRASGHCEDVLSYNSPSGAFVSWFDRMPRKDMRRELTPLVRAELEKRGVSC